MKLICIGRNYAAHAAELGNARPEQPIVFMKPGSAILPNNKPFYYPEFSQDIHYEVEIVVKIAKNGRHVDPQFAMDYVESIGLGLDLTARDLQQACKEKGHPWEIAKAFDHSAPLSPDFLAPASFAQLDDIEFSLEKNGQEVQHGHSRNMLFPIPELITYVSQFFRLQKGDLIFTGTPEGVGALTQGDELVGYLYTTEGKREMLRTRVR
ncbi:2-keto-4-pentenoate hydratase/2-oxohepta-3-ene-1,7-dioic acid hydratase in catechol pathway [Lewinella marina]|uniref:2-hydroxyhepta-2,4-diene-1,7-dioate isomerase n=1 Tax=Neolewinella marina TaxID=438751 RepID=A0A2G0CGR3_9BACT|nr:fumarylacetoacetate hydrolase family protein [Neolewinella marina]NJB86384.1 2-keto-4-pentenoate hydratase/2-oxohepta-3-ene-1,7-dioic acid hydratase in catechol pathway [Neolewinella marina]PHK99148.1 2-hydroxyhepta-2,4-diene-1,7-dioate isomerase [Neolewinella marina]